MFFGVRNTAQAVIIAALLCGTAARADIVFDFSGTCSSQCSGTATGVLDLTNAYVFGSDITPATFVSFNYVSSALTFTIPAPPSFLVGGLNADGSFNGPDGFQVFGGNFEFQAFPTEFVALGQGPNADLGTSSRFALVPEPSAAMLLALGFAGLGMALRTRRA
jgi:hypothetical protein